MRSGEISRRDLSRAPCIAVFTVVVLGFPTTRAAGQSWAPSGIDISAGWTRSVSESEGSPWGIALDLALTFSDRAPESPLYFAVRGSVLGPTAIDDECGVGVPECFQLFPFLAGLAADLGKPLTSPEGTLVANGRGGVALFFPDDGDTPVLGLQAQLDLLGRLLGDAGLTLALRGTWVPRHHARSVLFIDLRAGVRFAVGGS